MSGNGEGPAIGIGLGIPSQNLSLLPLFVPFSLSLSMKDKRFDLSTEAIEERSDG